MRTCSKCADYTYHSTLVFCEKCGIRFDDYGERFDCVKLAKQMKDLIPKWEEAWVPYQYVAGVQVKCHLLTGYFELSAAGMQSSDKEFWNRDKRFNPAKAPNCVSIAGPNRANSFKRACTFIIEHRAQGGDAIATSDDQLVKVERLSNLRASGAISDAEFAAMKKRLMDSL